MWVLTSVDNLMKAVSDLENSDLRPLGVSTQTSKKTQTPGCVKNSDPPE